MGIRWMHAVPSIPHTAGGESVRLVLIGFVFVCFMPAVVLAAGPGELIGVTSCATSTCHGGVVDRPTVDQEAIVARVGSDRLDQVLAPHHFTARSAGLAHTVYADRGRPRPALVG